MTWCATELAEQVHVHPAYEQGHILGPWCWCNPNIEHEPDVRPLITHRDQLNRVGPEDPEHG